MEKEKAHVNAGGGSLRNACGNLLRESEKAGRRRLNVSGISFANAYFYKTAFQDKSRMSENMESTEILLKNKSFHVIL